MKRARPPFLKLLAATLPVALASALPAACGGKVVIDVGGGGSGAAGSSASTTGPSNTTATSTSSGLPLCSCDQFCDIMLDCGYSTKDCVDFACAQIPLDTQQCVCKEAPLVMCDFLDTCFK
jgi:hypothetical protein